MFSSYCVDENINTFSKVTLLLNYKYSNFFIMKKLSVGAAIAVNISLYMWALMELPLKFN